MGRVSVSGCRNPSHPAAAPRRCRSRLRLPRGSPDALCGTQKCSLAAAVFPGFPLCLQQTGTEPGLPGPRGTRRNLPLEETPEVREPAFPGPLPSHRGLPGHLVQAQPPPLPQPHASEAPCSRTFPARPPEKVKGSSGRSQVGGFRRCPLSEWPHRRKGPAAGPGRGALGPGAEGRPAVRVEAVASLFN